MFNRSSLIFALYFLFSAGWVHAEKIKNTSYQFDIDIPNGWQIQNDFPEAPNCALTFANPTTLVALYVNTLDGQKDRYNIRKIRDNRHDLFVPSKAQLIDEDLQPFYNLLRDRIVRTFRLSDSTYLKQSLIVKNNTLFIVNALNIHNDFSETDTILNSLNLHPSILSNFYLLKDNIQSDNPFTTGVIPVAILILFAFLGWGFMRYRKTNPWLGVVFAILSLGAFAGTYFTLKSDPLFAILGLAVCFILWISLAKTKLTQRLDKMAEKIDLD